MAEKLTNTGFISDNSSWSVAAVPASGWVEVPGNSTYSTTNFLSMKYEAKNVGGVATSQAASTPWVSISQTSAITACSALGSGYHLITNNEWMTVARNGEAQSTNWTLGAVGSGYLFAGHNDNAPAAAKAASSTDTGNNRCAYTDTAGTTEAPSPCPTNTANNTSGTAGNQVRTHTLSNGAVIWDLAGNVWEWNSNTIQGKDQPTGSTPGFTWREFTALTTYGTLSYDLVRPLSTSYNATYGVGRIYSDGTASNTTLYAFLRGGSWNAGANAGAFPLGLGDAPGATLTYVGFRCASDPVAISQSFSSSSGRVGAGGNTVTIGSISDGKLYQSVNVGDTSTYNISAYVYNNTAGSVGGTVDTNVVQLYYGGNTISNTAWTAVSGETGWYKLTGTVTGVASGVDSGVLVKSGKTVIVDDVSLSKEYNASGTLTSSIFDSEFTIGAAWGTLTYSSSGSTVAVKARTSNSSSMTGATAFASCSAITSGSDISTNSCVTDSHRYIQYQLTLSTSDTSSTPTFSDISIAFATFDADAPSISLTALTPDPNSDNTPTLSGTATESVGTVSNVQFQMDSTSGSWTACTASDGSFDEATETFTCTPSALSDGSHTMYVRATDSNSNTTSNASASTDTFTIDVTAPASFDLDFPGHNSYTTNDRPTFKWKATTDATSGLSSYTLEIDNGDTGDFSITGIPASRTTDYDTSKYLVHYDGFSDSDSTNNYISIYTKSSSSWGTGENDGKLKEGSAGWKIKAVDNAGNERSEGRIVIVDFTSPILSSLSISDSLGKKNSYKITTNQSPSITGTITDTYYPDKVETAIYKENYFLGTLTSTELIITRTQSLSNTSSTSLSFSVPASQTLDYGSYHVDVTGFDKAGNKSTVSTLYLKVVTAKQAQELLQGKLSKKEKETIQEQAQISLPELEKKAILRREKEASEFRKLTQGFSDQINVIGKVTGNVILSISEGSRHLFTFVLTSVRDSSGYALRMTGNVGTFTSEVVLRLRHTSEVVLAGVGAGLGTVGNGMMTASSNFNQMVSESQSVIASTSEAISSQIKIATSRLAFGQTYNNLAQKAPGMIKNTMLAVEHGVNAVSSTIGQTNQLALNTLNKSQANLEDKISKTSKETADNFKTTSSVIASAAKQSLSLFQTVLTGVRDSSGYALRMTGNVIASTSEAISNSLNRSQEGTQKQIAQTHKNTSDTLKDKSNRISKGISLAFRSIQKPAVSSKNFADRLVKSVTIAVVTFESYMFDNDPTKIADVALEEVGKDYAIVSWKTNHYARNNKVNYGTTLTYGEEAWGEDGAKEHRVKITRLKPGEKYYFEVMSQNKNYAYDAYYSFETKK